MKNKHFIIPIFVPHKGCPYDCIYCNQRSISGQYQDMTEEKMREIIEQYVSLSNKHKNIEIAFYGGNFTGIPTQQQIKLLTVANEYIRKGIVKEIRLSTRPDYINEEILEYLIDYNVRTIEIGAQSLDHGVLQVTHRGHSHEEVISACKLIKNKGFNLGIQTMIGLPGDDNQKALNTAEKIIDLTPKMVRIYPTLVIKGTYLEKMYFDGSYKPLELEEAVDLCTKLLNMYEKAEINVIRIGLQPTKNISLNGDVVAGPFHPAFRQLVHAKIILYDIENEINTYRSQECNKLVIITNRRNVSNVIGQNSTNISYLRNKYKFSKIDVITADVHKVKVICS